MAELPEEIIQKFAARLVRDHLHHLADELLAEYKGATWIFK